jgi:hypothetical protein
MRLLTLLSVFVMATLSSDLARVYPPGTEPAKGNQNLSVVAVNGKELAHNGNSGLAHQQSPGTELTK